MTKPVNFLFCIHECLEREGRCGVKFFRYIALFLLTLCVSAHAERGQVIFGSFSTNKAAQQWAGIVSSKLSIAAQIDVTTNANRIYNRVTSELMNEKDARALIRQARRAGYSDVWYLVSKDTLVLTQNEIGSEVRREKPEEMNSREPELKRMPENPAVRPKSSYSLARLKRTTAAVMENERDSLTPLVKEVKAFSRRFDAVTIPPVDKSTVSIDGRVDEPIWETIPAFSELRVVQPDTLVKPDFGTLARLFYTDKGIFVGVEMEQPPGTLVERLSTRDKSMSRDEFGLSIDTSGEGKYGYFFNISLGGTKSDGKILPERNISLEWDGAWEGKTAVTDSGWTAEMFIPWSILSMPDRERTRSLPFALSRYVAYKSENWMWPALPFSGSTYISGFQPMELDGVNPKQQWEVFPYISSALDRKTEETKGKAGVDLNWRPSSSLQVTATVSPDFGAVETDDVVVNLTAYETFFPEKRLFFLEGNEVFVTSPRGLTSSTGMSGDRTAGARRPTSPWTMEPTTLLNTRRIGGAPRNVEVPEGLAISATELSAPTDLIGAAKVVGQYGTLRYGLLTAVEDDVELRATDLEGLNRRYVMEGRDFNVLRLSHESVGKGRRAIGYLGTIMRGPAYEAITHGIDAHLRTATGQLMIDGQFLASDKEDENGYGVFADINWFPKQGQMHQLEIDYLDDKLDISDMGFIRRNDQKGIKYRRMSIKSQGLPDWILSRRLGVMASYSENDAGRKIPRGNWVGTFSMLQLSNRAEVQLMTTYKIAGWDDRESRGNGSFRTEPGHMIMLTYGSDSSRKFSYSVQIGTQPEELGHQSPMADFGITYRPTDRFGLEFDYRYFKRNNWLVHRGERDFTTYDAVQLAPTFSFDYFLSANQQLRLSMQWIGVDADESRFLQLPEGRGEFAEREKDADGASEDFTLSRLTWQFRYRWEIAPMSDLFVVYTRGSNLPSRENDDFEGLLSDAFTDTVIDSVILKLRYRFGS